VSRREFIALSGRAAIAAIAAIAAPLSAEPQARIWKIGVFHVGDHIPPDLENLRDGLKALGYEEGKNLELAFRNLADESAASTVARDFVQARVDVIVAFGNPTVRAAKSATSSIPIVMVHVTDPVEHGYVNTLARPGGNTTGFVYFAVSPAKHVQLFKEIAPSLRRILVLADPQDPAAAGQLAEMRVAAEMLKLELIEHIATDQTDVERLFAGMKPGDVDGVMVASINLQIQLTNLLIRLAAAKRMALATYRKEAVQEGALFSYAPDIRAVGRRVAVQVDKILKGTDPKNIPVEQPTRFELVINLKSANALGIEVPASLLARADAVIE
jgi:putative tryptophan/tyrosine transport system substrate-binding protein